MKWTSDLESFSKVVYEAGTAFFEAVNSLLDGVNDGLHELEELFEKYVGPLDAPDPEEPSREDEALRMLNELVRWSEANHMPMSAQAWRNCINDHTSFLEFVDNDARFETLKEAHAWYTGGGR